MDKWDKRRLELAQFVARWSKDPSAQVGAVIADSLGRVIALGYNGFAVHIEDREERLTGDDKLKMILHAEENAVLIAGERARGGTIYVFGKPVCAKCAAVIIQSGIKRVVGPFPEEATSKWTSLGILAIESFNEAKIEYEQTRASQLLSTQEPSMPNCWNFWKDWSTIERFNCLLLVFTGVYALISILQYRLTRQAIHVTERAYLQVHAIALEPAVASVGPIRVTILVKNTGRTPATITDVNIVPSYVTGPDFTLPKIPSYAEKGSNLAALGLLPAGETDTDTSAAIGLNGQRYGFDKGQVKDIETGKSRFFVYGYVRYQDAFAHNHATGFCGFYDPTRTAPELGMFNRCRQAGYTYAY